MSDHALTELQDETLGVLRRHLVPGQSVALVDFPSHKNAGDSLIYLGERAYLDRIGVSVDYLCDIERYDPDLLRECVPHGPILLHGGGNIGDRWPKFQQFRERVITDFPDRKILQLPQSIEFGDPAALEGARRVFGDHPDLTILTREAPSTSFAREQFDVSVEFCPDGALGVGYLPRLRDVMIDTVMVLRQDSEKVDRDIPLRRSHMTQEIDWGISGPREIAWKAYRAPGSIVRRVPSLGRTLLPLVARSYQAQARLNVDQARRRIGIAHTLVTDRLHGAVLGALTRMSVVALDNSYGKVSSIHDAYLHRLGIQFASTGEEAAAMVKQLHP